MDRQTITPCELVDQVQAEARRISATGLDGEKRDRLAAIRRRRRRRLNSERRRRRETGRIAP